MLSAAIRKQFDDLTLDVQFDMRDGVLVLFGPSGAGKSLTIKMIAGLERPDAGLISINERTVFDANAGIDLPPRDRRVGYVPQGSALWPHLTALDNVSLAVQSRLGTSQTSARDEARELLTTLGLEQRIDAYPHQLSGGQAQRVAFARALASRPDLLLLDEPFSALDAPVRQELRSVFVNFQRELDIPAIFITHDIEEAAALASTLCVLLDGRIRQTGSVRDILDRPVDREVAELVQARNLIAVSGTNDGLLNTEIGQLQISEGTASSNVTTAVIRPDAVRILTGSEAGKLSCNNVMSGVILDVVDYASRITITMACGSSSIEASLPPGIAREMELAPGTPVTFAIPSDQIHVI